MFILPQQSLNFFWHFFRIDSLFLQTQKLLQIINLFLKFYHMVRVSIVGICWFDLQHDVIGSLDKL